MKFSNIPIRAKTGCFCAALAAGLPFANLVWAQNYHPADINQNHVIERAELEALFDLPAWRQDLETQMLRAVQLFNAGGYVEDATSWDGFKPASLDYLVLNLESNTVERLEENQAPGVWTDEYKTTKLVLRRIKAGTFTMGSPASELGRNPNETQQTVTLAQDYFIGVFPVTQRQWELVMGAGARPSHFSRDEFYAARPVENVSYNATRGAGDNPVANSFLGRLRAKYAGDALGLRFDLPTEAQWEYACRATTTNALNNGMNLTTTGNQAPFACPNLNPLARYLHNPSSNSANALNTSDLNAGTATVGSYERNLWGLYDMHGNVQERCLDLLGGNRVVRGGAWNLIASQARSARRLTEPAAGLPNISIGLRVCAPMPATLP